MISIEAYDKHSIVIDLFLRIDLSMERENGRYKHKAIENMDTSMVNRKRSRSFCRSQHVEQIVRDIIALMDKYDLFTTFKTLVDKKFFHLLANNMDNTLFTQVSLFVQEFRSLISKADIYLKDENDYEFYHILTDDIMNILSNAQQVVLLFNLSCVNKN